MGWSVFFWIEAVVALFFGLLMLIDALKYKERLFRLLFFFYLIIALKSFLYIILGLGDYLLSKDPKISLYYLVFQAAELVYTAWIFYVITSSQKTAEGKSTRGTAVISLVIALTGVLFTGAIAFISVRTGDSYFKTNIDSIEIIKTWLGNWIYIVPKFILLVIAWRSTQLMASAISSPCQDRRRFPPGNILFFPFRDLFQCILFDHLLPETRMVFPPVPDSHSFQHLCFRSSYRVYLEPA